MMKSKIKLFKRQETATRANKSCKLSGSNHKILTKKSFPNRKKKSNFKVIK